MAKPTNGTRKVKTLLIAAVLVGIVSLVYFNSPLAPGKLTSGGASQTRGPGGGIVDLGEVELEVEKPVSINLSGGRTGSLTLLSDRPINGGISVQFKMVATNRAENVAEQKIESVTAITSLTPGKRNLFTVRDTPFAVTPKVKSP